MNHERAQRIAALDPQDAEEAVRTAIRSCHYEEAYAIALAHPCAGMPWLSFMLRVIVEAERRKNR